MSWVLIIFTPKSLEKSEFVLKHCDTNVFLCYHLKSTSQKCIKCHPQNGLSPILSLAVCRIQVPDHSFYYQIPAIPLHAICPSADLSLSRSTAHYIRSVLSQAPIHTAIQVCFDVTVYTIVFPLVCWMLHVSVQTIMANTCWKPPATVLTVTV